jgi:hypothetical protein
VRRGAGGEAAGRIAVEAVLDPELTGELGDLAVLIR